MLSRFVGNATTARRVTRLGIRVREVNHSEAAYLTDRRVFERALFPYPFNAGDVESMLQRLAGKE